MQRPSFAEWPCSLARVVDLVGDPWTPLILRDAFHGVRRFDEFQRSLNIARNTLADRLRRLVEAGLLRTAQYQSNPPRNEYLLTEMGTELFPITAAMVSFGDRWLSGPAGPPVVIHHTTGDHAVRPAVCCAECGELLDLSDVEFRVGPGYPRRLPAGVPDLRSHLVDPPAVSN